MSSKTGSLDIPGTHFAQARLGAMATAATADEWCVFRAPGPVTIKKLSIAWNASITGAATDNFAVAAQNKGTAGTGTTAVSDTKTYTSGVNATAFLPDDLTLSTTAANLELAANEVLSIKRTVNGTGLASPDGLVLIEYMPK
jgi:hypothetical protein